MSNAKRNDPCPCGSGKKYKQCCLKQDEAAASSARAENVSIPKAIQMALEHHQAGRFAEAEGVYRQILQVQPEQADALHLLGMLMQQLGKSGDAINLIIRAIDNSPGYFLYHNNLGTIYQSLNEVDKAIACYRRALALKPDYADACYNLANALRAQAKVGEAIKCYRKAIALKPDYVEAYNNLGVVLKDNGALGESAECYRKAIALKPNFVEALNNLGNVLKDQGVLDKAVACFQKALALRPDHAEAHNNLGNALKGQGKLWEAVACYQKALAINPGYADALFNLGNLKQAIGAPNEAIDLYRKIIALMPHHTDAYINLGGLLAGQNRLDEAIECYRKVIALEPESPDAHSNLGMMFNFQGRLDEAVACFQKAIALKPDYASAHSNLLFLHGYHTSLDPHEYLSLARRWELACLSTHERQLAHNKIFRRSPLANRRLRVGYVSGDYRQHAVSYFIEKLFAHHDKTRIELFAYSTNGVQDAVTERLQALVEHWAPVVGMTDATVLDRIELDGIDVLIDLAGHTAHGRLGIFARRAAPVQAHYLGYFASTGLTEMDYWIGDEILTPAETDSHFSERVWRLPRVWICYDGKADAPLPDWHPAQNSVVWLGSFNNLGKLTPATLVLWARVLQALPEGRLLLKTKELADASNRQRILDTMTNHGIAPDRIELWDGSTTPGWREHMACYNQVDIALDPVGGVGGGTTTCDALWMGVPVITLKGDRMATRMTASMLDAVGRPEWIAHTETEYLGKVIALARDVEQRKSLRSSQRDRMASSPLCDARGLVMSLENCYFEMFERWQAR